MLGPEWAGMVVSEGTLVPEDLVEKFLSVLETADEDVAEKRAEYDAIMERAEDYGYGKRARDAQDAETLDYLLDELHFMIEDIVPDGCYFGTSEGDGACYGFWTIEDVDY